jgi:hypothetical protein
LKEKKKLQTFLGKWDKFQWNERHKILGKLVDDFQNTDANQNLKKFVEGLKPKLGEDYNITQLNERILLVKTAKQNLTSTPEAVRKKSQETKPSFLKQIENERRRRIRTEITEMINKLDPYPKLKGEIDRRQSKLQVDGPIKSYKEVLNLANTAFENNQLEFDKIEKLANKSWLDYFKKNYETTREPVNDSDRLRLTPVITPVSDSESRDSTTTRYSDIIDENDENDSPRGSEIESPRGRVSDGDLLSKEDELAAEQQLALQEAAAASSTDPAATATNPAPDSGGRRRRRTRRGRSCTRRVRRRLNGRRKTRRHLSQRKVSRKKYLFQKK